MPEDVEKIVAGLTRAQREGLCTSPCQSWWGNLPGCMPHRIQTTFALWRMGLCEMPPVGTSAARLTALGKLVRTRLLFTPNAEKSDVG